MKTKILLIALSLLTGLQFTHAQYLVSATYIMNRNASEIETFLTDVGYDVSSMDINGAASYKITYNTVDVFGNPTIASGALYVPQVDCDTLPLVSCQHGTQFNRLYVPSNNKYQNQGLIFSGNGFITTLPDYLGLGVNTDLHPYLHWESEATASIDLIRAAREYLTDSLGIWDNNQLFLTGYSQGGHAAMAIHKYITNNNLQSEFNVVASAPMSGPFPLYDAQRPGIFDGDSTYYVAEFLPYVFASYQMVYGNLYENPNEYYDPPFDEIIPEWLASGTHTDYQWHELIPDNYYDFMQDTVVDNIINDPNHPFNIDLRLNDLHSWVPDEPVRMLYCDMDSMVYAQNSLMALDTMKALGATDVQALDLDPNGIHETCWIETYVYAVMWFDSLNAGCQMVIPTCMPNGASFSTQAKIDNFQSNYPYCIEIAGDVEISGNDITNLDGLSSLIVIGGDLEIHTNEALENLSGLDSLRSIGGNFKAYLNDVLTDFTGLENLSTIDGNLAISYNPLLNSLDGLDNIEPGSIDNLTITDNDNLTKCDVESICVYLDISDGIVRIQDNKSGCNSQEEVEMACPVSIDEISLSNNILTHPNPFSTSTTIEYELSEPGTVRITIYSQMGGQVEVIEQSGAQGLNKVVWTPKNLPNGIYYFSLQAGEQIGQGKVVLMR